MNSKHAETRRGKHKNRRSENMKKVSKIYELPFFSLSLSSCVQFFSRCDGSERERGEARKEKPLIKNLACIPLLPSTLVVRF
jgi:hypothetical protein